MEEFREHEKQFKRKEYSNKGLSVPGGRQESNNNYGDDDYGSNEDDI